MPTERDRKEALKIVKNRKLLAELMITLLFFIASLYYIHTNELRTNLQLILQVNVHYEGTQDNQSQDQNEDQYRLYIDDDPPLDDHVYPSKEFQPVVFKLPSRTIKNMRLLLGEKPGTIVIKKIILKSLLNQYEWTGKKIRKLFHPQQLHQVGKNYVKNNSLYIQAIGDESFITMDEAFCRFINQAGSKKIFFYLLSPFISLLFFYLLHFFNPRGLFMFLNRKVMTNMSLLFLVILFFPLLDGLFFITPKSRLVEKRKMAEKPDFRFDAISQYPGEYNSYYNDHFAGRAHLIYLNNLLKLKLFGISAVPKVLVGQQGWLFMDKTVVRHGTVDYFRSADPFSIEELEQWKRLLEERQAWLAARGIFYLFVIAPNKNTIYPEFMPDRIRKVHPRSRMDQLVEYLEQHSTVSFLDLRNVLLDAKNKYPVYSRTDTHWNDYGAYIAYREIMKYVARYFKEAEPLSLSRFKIKILNKAGGDLAEMLSLHLEVLRENMIRLIPHPPLTAAGHNLENIARFVRQSYRECKTAPLPNIMMVHDSFYQRLRHFLSESFSRVLYVWDWNLNFYPEVVEREKPQLVIDEMAERFLLGKIPINPESLSRK